MTSETNNYIIWIDVVGYEEEYEVSNTGLIRTKEGKTTHTEHHGERVWKQRTLKQKVDKENSCRVDLWRDGKHTTHLVHRLVAKSFIPEIDGKNCINHKDGNRLNNFVENLEWNTHKENQNHAFDNDLTTTNHKIKLTKISTGEEFVFRSKSKAGQFLGKNDGYISLRLKRGHKEVDGYKISKITDTD